MAAFIWGELQLVTTGCKRSWLIMRRMQVCVVDLPPTPAWHIEIVYYDVSGVSWFDFAAGFGLLFGSLWSVAMS